MAAPAGASWRVSFKQMDQTPIVLTEEIYLYPIDETESCGERKLAAGDVVFPIREDSHLCYVVCLTRHGPAAVFAKDIGWNQYFRQQCEKEAALRAQCTPVCPPASD